MLSTQFFNIDDCSGLKTQVQNTRSRKRSLGGFN